MERLGVVGVVVVVLVSTLAVGVGMATTQPSMQSQPDASPNSPSASQASQASLPSLQCGNTTYDVDVRKAVGLYHENTDAVPPAIAPLVAANTTELRIDGASQRYYTIYMDSSLSITAVDLSQPSNPDVIVSTNRATACTVFTSATPASTAQTAYADGDISVRATNPVDQVKVSVVEGLTNIADFLN